MNFDYWSGDSSLVLILLNKLRPIKIYDRIFLATFQYFEAYPFPKLTYCIIGRRRFLLLFLGVSKYANM